MKNGDIQNMNTYRKKGRWKEEKLTLKRKFLRWSGPLWWTMTNSGCNIRCLLHSSMRAETGCFPAQERRHMRRWCVFGTHVKAQFNDKITLLPLSKRLYSMWYQWGIFCKMATIYCVCDETGESTVTLFSDFMLSIESDACCILLSIWYTEYCIILDSNSGLIF